VDPAYVHYVGGKLALAGLDESRVSAAGYLDAVYAILLEGPGDEQLRKVHDQIVIKMGMVKPDRETWGLHPDQIAMQNRLVGQRVPHKT
jgi:hypothetical protein